MINPAFPALLAQTVGQEPRNEGPLLRAIFLDSVPEDSILLLRPRTLGEEQILGDGPFAHFVI